MKTEINPKSISATILALTLFTFIALAYYRIGFNRSLDPVNNDNFSLRVNTDQDHGGQSRGHIERTESNALLLTCDISYAYKHPFCEVSFDYTPKPGSRRKLDLSVFDAISFDIRYQGVSNPKARFIIRNHHKDYSVKGDLQSDKFNIFEFNTDSYNKETPLSIDYLYVPKWWVDYYKHPIVLTAVDISNPVSIEIGTEELVKKGLSQFEIRSITFHGKWLPLSDYLKIIIFIWMVTLLTYVGLYILKIKRRLASEKMQRVSLTKHLRTLQKEVSLDPLTGLRNRHRLTDLFSTIEKIAQQGTNVSLGIFDIDHFKRINDQHGHTTGDKVLKQISEMLIESSAETNILIRWGGEEFVVILVDNSFENSIHFFDNFRKSLKVASWPNDLCVTASFGLVEVRSESIEEAILKADERLYQAKSNGRDQIVVR